MKKRVLCYGDSNTWGYIAGSMGERYGEDIRWTSVMQSELGDSYTVLEQGYNGRTTVWEDSVDLRMSGYSTFEMCLETASPVDLVVIMLGTNDTKCYFSANEVNISVSVGRIAELALKSCCGVDGGAPEVLIVAPPLIENPKFDGMFDERSVSISKKFAEVFSVKAEELGVGFFDAARDTRPDPRDGVHSLPESHVELGRAMAAKVKEIIG